MRKLAQDQNDFHLTNFLDTNAINNQFKFIDELARMITNLNRVGGGLGIYIFDKYIHW